MCAYAEYAVHASVVSHLARHSCLWVKAEKGRAALASEALPDSEKKKTLMGLMIDRHTQ